MGISISDTISAFSLWVPDVFILEPDPEPELVRSSGTSSVNEVQITGLQRGMHTVAYTIVVPNKSHILFVCFVHVFGSMFFYSFQEAQFSFSVLASWTCSDYQNIAEIASRFLRWGPSVPEPALLFTMLQKSPTSGDSPSEYAL